MVFQADSLLQNSGLWGHHVLFEHVSSCQCPWPTNEVNFFNEILAKKLGNPMLFPSKKTRLDSLYTDGAHGSWWFLMGSSWESAASTSSSGMSVQSVPGTDTACIIGIPILKSCWLFKHTKKTTWRRCQIYIYIIAQLASAHTLWQDIHNIWH